ncbi:MAG: branched-chain-amino-acid transaminase [Spirochaetia bacterium]
MGKGFTLSMYPWTYIAKYHDTDKRWTEEFEKKPHLTQEQEAEMEPEKQANLLAGRNSFPELPLVNYTTQYGYGCFEGLKAFPQPDGSLKIFRLDENAKRMNRSMRGLKMPAFPEELFEKAVLEVIKRNKDLGFSIQYDKEWEKDDFASGHSIYIRPFSYSEPAIGLGIPQEPWVIVVTTPVGSYFKPGSKSAVTTNRVRATHHGTGWIKCDANYVIPTLAKKEAEAAGYMEAIFLDAQEKTYVEEGSSCNIFFYLKNGSLVTPELDDTILPGINRASVLQLAKDQGVKTEERKISIDEAMSEAKEVFVTGTAAGISYISSITHKGNTTEFTDDKPGELTETLHRALKGIQYGAQEDVHNWMVRV